MQAVATSRTPSPLSIVQYGEFGEVKLHIGRAERP